jgi:hypothetical protein
MPRDIKLLTIFVSCPQDLAPERSVLESVIDELNQKLRDSHSVEFRTASDVPVQELDLAQLGKVQEFRKRISPQVLYSNFKTPDDFLKQVRDHLWQLIMHEWKGGKWTVPASAPAKTAAQLPSTLSNGDSVGQKRPAETISESEEEGEEYAAGLLDAVVEAQESMEAGLAALSRITTITAENNSKLERHAKEIGSINSSGGNARHLRTAVNAAADDIAAYARSLRAEVPAFIAGFSLAFSSLETALAAWIEEGHPKRSDLVETREGLDKGIAAIRSSRDSVVNFRDTIGAVPRLTSRLKKALRSTKTQLDELIAGITVISDRGATILERLKTASDTPENDSDIASKT